ncbi:MAG: putative regulatory protein, FmdB family [Chloroflexi bacterium]|nr:putative regulatory protein, FmdB family [Chloroflexota bacterium]
MPIYEYRCNACGRRSQVFFRSFSAAERQPSCPHCSSADMGKVPSRVARIRSDSSYDDMMSDPSSLESIDYNDPRQVAQWARKMGEAAGVDLGDDYDEMIEQIESGTDVDDLPLDGLDDDF